MDFHRLQFLLFSNEPAKLTIFLGDSEYHFGKYKSPDCGFLDSRLSSGNWDPSLRNSDDFSESIRKSSSVARDFNCRPREAIVFWHSASLLEATASSLSCRKNHDKKGIYISTTTYQSMAWSLQWCVHITMNLEIQGYYNYFSEK